jgi:magnesium transporter
MAALQRGRSDLLSEGVDLYLRDLHDHATQAIETAETYRDMLSSLTDLYLSGASNRMNEIMKVLAVIATIFMPLTLLAGVYGMNFKNMPELDWRWGYPAALAAMALAAGGMLFYFRRKRWL